MAIIVKSIALLLVLSIVSNGAQAQNTGPDVFALADKLSELFGALSNTKLTLEEKYKLSQFQETLTNTWYTLSNAIKNIDPSKTLDAYIALVNNQKQLLSQILNVFNLGELNKWSQLIADTLISVSLPGVNCNSTGCALPSWNNTSYNNYTTGSYPWVTNSSSNNTTWYPTGSYYTANYTTGGPFVTEYPFGNFTEWFGNTTAYPFFNTTGGWNWNTTGGWNWNTTDGWSWNTTGSSFNYTTGSWQNNSTGGWNWNTTDGWSWNTTGSSFNYTTGSWQNNSTGGWNWNTTDGWSWNTTGSSFNYTTSSWIKPIGTNSSSNTLFIDSELCQYYSYADCTNRLEISLLCPAMCRCKKCENNGTMAIQESTGECKCICKSGFGGDSCETSLCQEKEYCSYFNDSYCTVAMINDNCPVLCNRCK